jgi:hypothetical protein
MSHDEKVLLLRMLDQFTTEEVKQAMNRYNQMSDIERDEVMGKC